MQFFQLVISNNNWLWFLLAAIISYFTTALIYKLGNKLSLIDIPNARSSHQTNTPKGGAIGIVLAVFCYSLVNQNYRWVWVAVVVALFSFYGDRKEFSFKLRILMQFFCGFVILLIAYYDLVLPKFVSSIFIWIFLLIYIVGSSNFFNFMDGIDGIAIITALVATSWLMVYAWQHSLPEWIFFLSILFAAICGFLPWNFSLKARAKVFMGDVGSIFLGFIITLSSLFIAKNWFDFFILCSILLPFYGDCLLTLLAKIKRKIPLTQPHRIHLYQILANEMKISHWKVSLGYGVTQWFFVALIFLVADSWVKLLLIMFAISIAMLLIYLLVRKKALTYFL